MGVNRVEYTVTGGEPTRGGEHTVGYEYVVVQNCT